MQPPLPVLESQASPQLSQSERGLLSVLSCVTEGSHRGAELNIEELDGGTVRGGGRHCPGWHARDGPG